MRKQGLVPLSMNVIRKVGKSIVGVYRQNTLEPLAVSRDRDEQRLGEMMSIAMQYLYQSQNIGEINARGYEEFLLSAVPVFRVGYEWNSTRKISDVTCELCDMNRMGWDENTSGQYFENISCIFYLHDMNISTVLSMFAHSKQEKERIIQIYQDAKSDVFLKQQHIPDKSRTHISFFHPDTPDKCRVYEIWTKEQYDSFLCHDIAKGSMYTIPVSEEDAIIAENNKRIQDMIAGGGTAQEAALIEYEYKVDEQWVVRYLTPNAYTLLQSETPYWHQSHPFAIGAYPLIDGEVHSLIGDLVNPQRMINRIIMRTEFQRMNQAKGFGIVNKKVLEKSGVSMELFASQFTSPNGIIALDWQPGEEIFKQYNESGVNSSDINMLQQYFSMISEISGANGPMRGEASRSGTPAALYAMQTQNANNNISDGEQWYNGLVRLRDYKMMMVMQQYYQEKRYLSITGQDYSEESKWYDPYKVRNSQFDLTLIQSQSSGVTRAMNENMLFELFRAGAIDPISYLESTSSPFADKLLERIKQRKTEQAQAQQQAQEQQALSQEKAQALQKGVEEAQPDGSMTQAPFMPQ